MLKVQAMPGAAHPRTGGENTGLKVGEGWVGGSSPHGRGKHDVDYLGRPTERLIPARAGKTHCVAPTP